MFAAPFSLPSSRPSRSFPPRNDSLIYPISVSLVKKQVIRKQQALLHETVSCRSDLGNIVRMRWVPLLERRAWITGSEALRLSFEERNERPGKIARIALAESRFPDVPPQVGAQRNLNVGVAQTVDSVAVNVNLWLEHGILSAEYWRFHHDVGNILDIKLRSTIEVELLIGHTGQGEVHRGNVRVMDLAQRHKSTRVERRIQARRRLPSIDDPLAERHQQRPLAVDKGVAVSPQLAIYRRARHHSRRLPRYVAAAVLSTRK